MRAITAVDITVRFGGVTAVDSASIEAEEGECVGLIGPNGSGKSTLLNALTGIVAADGTVTVGENRLALGHPQRSRGAGVLRVFQAPQTFDDLSCLENVLISQADRRFTGLAASCFLRPLMMRRERGHWARASAVLDRVGLEGMADAQAGQLSYGQRRILELARALFAEPRVLLLDEPSAGLNNAETDVLAVLLEELVSEGLTAILVDHKVDFVDRLCSRIVVLETGRVIANGSPQEIWSDERVIDAYLGVARHA